MRSGVLPGILAGTCLLLSGCPDSGGSGDGGSGPVTTDPEPPHPVNLNEAINVVGADWKDSTLASKDTGGPTVVPPKVTSNSDKSFDVEVAEVAAGHTLDDVAQLAIAIDGFTGHHVFDVGPDDRTPAGSILVTIVQEQAALLSGAFTLQVVAADTDGQAGEIVDVSAAFFAASAGEDSIVRREEAEDTVVDLHATFTGETGSTQVTWSRVAGPEVTITNWSAANATFVPPTAGTYVMKLEAVDATGVVDLDLVSILVVDEFTVDAGESGVIMVHDIVCLRGLAAGGSGQATFVWTEISDHGVIIEDTGSCAASFVVQETGEHEFELAATDDNGDTASDHVIYLAVDGLTARIDPPDQVELGATIQLQGQAGGGLYPYAFRWTQTDGPEVDIKDSTNQTALVSLSDTGTYTFELRVEDSTAFAAIASVTISVVCMLASGCDDGDACTTDTCDVESGECSNDAVVCDDEFDCTEDTCDAELGCVFENITGGCDDEDACTENDVCADGVCAGTANDCDDQDACTDDSCDTVDGCVHTPVSCEEGSECNPETDECPPPLFPFLTCGDLIPGSIDAAAEVDFFTFEAQAGDEIFLTLVQAGGWGGSSRAQATLFDPMNVELLTYNANSTQQFTIEQIGTYVVRLRANNLVTTGSYTLGMECLIPPSPNPTSLSCGDLVEGSIDAAAEVDFFTFEAQAGDEIFLTLVQAGGWGGSSRAQATLFDPMNVELLTYNANSTQQFTIEQIGTYVVRLRANNLVTTGSYTLGMECLPPPP